MDRPSPVRAAINIVYSFDFLGLDFIGLDLIGLDFTDPNIIGREIEWPRFR
jgi:hypothetical protein